MRKVDITVCVCVAALLVVGVGAHAAIFIGYMGLSAAFCWWLLGALRRRGRRHTPGTPTTVYYLIDPYGALLYVGVSCDLQRRLREHQQTKPWFWQVARVYHEVYPSRSIALAVERVAIAEQQPCYNVAGR